MKRLLDMDAKALRVMVWLQQRQIEALLEYLAEVQKCREYRGPEGIGALIGELDAAAEVHRLIEEI